LLLGESVHGWWLIITVGPSIFRSIFVVGFAQLSAWFFASTWKL